MKAIEDMTFTEKCNVLNVVGSGANFSLFIFGLLVGFPTLSLLINASATVFSWYVTKEHFNTHDFFNLFLCGLIISPLILLFITGLVR